MNTTIKNSVNGFSSFTININNILEDLVLQESIKLFFSSLQPNKKYFIILRLQYQESLQFVTLHPGLIIQKDQNQQYHTYCRDILSIKSAEYRDSSYSALTFDYFLIPEDKEQYYIDKWSVLPSLISPLIKDKFGNSTIEVSLPLNRSYAAPKGGGQVILKTVELKIVQGNDYTYRIKLNEKTNIDI